MTYAGRGRSLGCVSDVIRCHGVLHRENVSHDLPEVSGLLSAVAGPFLLCWAWVDSLGTYNRFCSGHIDMADS
jgi:hypothetical protein